MPEEGVEQVAHSEILTYSEIARICRICADKGISKIKLTGGEPLVRKGISGLLYELRQIDGIEQITLTTNGVLLAGQIENWRKRAWMLLISASIRWSGNSMHRLPDGTSLGKRWKVWRRRLSIRASG